MAGNRTILGSETDDTKHVELDRLGAKVALPVSIYDSSGNQVTTFSSSGSTPATSVGNGNGKVVTGGTAVRLSATSVPCKRVVIFNVETNGNLANSGIIVVGGSDVVANPLLRKGATIFPANGLTFNVGDLNLLYLDSTDNNAVYNYYYEN